MQTWMRVFWSVPCVAAACAMAVLIGPAVAAAQEPVQVFDRLDTRLKVGDTVWLTDAQGREIKGRLTSLEPTSLAVDAKGLRRFRADEVRLLVQQRRDSLKNGVLWGAGIGFLSGVVMTCVGDSEMCSDPEGVWATAVVGLIGMGAGAGIGAGIDGLIHSRDVVYRAPGAGPGARLSFAPIVTARRRGVRLVFSF